MKQIQYKLLKDLPYIPKGTIGNLERDNRLIKFYSKDGKEYSSFYIEEIPYLKKWIKKIKGRGER